jgi:hypothetical protein
VLAILATTTASSASARSRRPTAPSCQPARVNQPATVAGGRLEVSPAPGARDASALTQISMLGAAPGLLSDIQVVGSRSGRHAGHLEGYSQGDGASFLPARGFVPGEEVSVSGRLGAQRFGWSFTVAVPDPISNPPVPTYPKPTSSTQIAHFFTRPDLQPPTFVTTTSSLASAGQLFFLTPYDGPGQAGPMIVNGLGSLVYFRALPTNTDATDFEVQQYQGEPVLTWWQGLISVHGYGLGEGMIVNDAYQTADVVHAGNGESADLHEFQLLGNGSALVTAYHPIRCDLASAGGPANGTLVDSMFQEIDVRTGLVRLEWSALNHLPLRDSYASIVGKFARFPYDWLHLNSVDVASDGSFIVSGRNTWAVYGVNARSGGIDWELGGRQSTFRLGPGVQTAFQHDARQQPNGEITAFDNGDSPQIHVQSRGVEVGLDFQTHTATLMRSAVHPGSAILSASMGSVQPLSGGNWVIGWGQIPDVSELNASGHLVFDGHFASPSTRSYRAQVFPWVGAPGNLPSIDVIPRPTGTAAVAASWNGSTALAAWRLLGGPTAASMQGITVVPRTGFETLIGLPAPVPRFVAVQALSVQGALIGQSQTIAG